MVAVEEFGGREAVGPGDGLEGRRRATRTVGRAAAEEEVEEEEEANIG